MESGRHLSKARVILAVSGSLFSALMGSFHITMKSTPASSYSMGALLCMNLTGFSRVTSYNGSSLQLLIDAIEIAISVEAAHDLVTIIEEQVTIAAGNLLPRSQTVVTIDGTQRRRTAWRREAGQMVLFVVGERVAFVGGHVAVAVIAELIARCLLVEDDTGPRQRIDSLALTNRRKLLLLP